MSRFVTLLAFLFAGVSAFYLTLDVWIWTTGAALCTSAVAPSAWRRRRRTLGRPLLRRTRPIERDHGDNLGHAEKMTAKEAHKVFTGPHKAYGGKVVGFGPDGRLLIDPCRLINGVSLEFAGSGGFKTSTLASSAAMWHGTLIIHDPSCELAPMLYRMMEASGKPVFIVTPDRNPCDEDGVIEPWANRIGQLNPLDWIDIRDPMAQVHVHTVAALMFGDEDEASARGSSGASADFFRKRARDLIACLLAHVLWREPIKDTKGNVIDPPRRDLVAMRDYISLPGEELQDALAHIRATSPSSMARRIAGPLAGMRADETFDGIHSEADNATSWLTIDEFAHMVSGNDFRTTDIVNNRMTIFVQIPLPILETHQVLARVVIGSLINAMIQANARGRQRMVALFLDEMRFLGRMKCLMTVGEAGRKYRLALHGVFQSEGQMEAVWGVLRRVWYDNATWRLYSSTRDNQSTKNISESAGTYGVIATSEGDNQGNSLSAGTSPIGRMSRSRGWVLNRHPIKRNLINPSEVTSDLAPEEAIILGLRKPLFVKRAMWWLVPWFKGKVQPSRFHTAAAAE